MKKVEPNYTDKLAARIQRWFIHQNFIQVFIFRIEDSYFWEMDSADGKTRSSWEDASFFGFYNDGFESLCKRLQWAFDGPVIPVDDTE